VSVIEVFADVWCPFTHVGLTRFVQRRSEADSTMPLWVRSWPLELVNDEALSFDFVAEKVDAIHEGIDTGLFVGLSSAAWPSTTLPALRLTCAGYESDLSVGEAIALDLRQRLFELGQDIAHPDVLDEVAAQHGLVRPADPADPDSDPPVAEWHVGQERGVQGSPHYFTQSANFFAPSLDIERVDGKLEVHADPSGFDRFARAVLEEN
jgi:predicted DsbA family dithiol-disulfide isomerase